MPQVPCEFVHTVMPQGQGVYNNIDKATHENFGGQMGQALDQAGNVLAQNALHRQQLANETNVNDVYANQFSPAARNIYQKHMALEGKDAEAQFLAYQQQMNDLRNQIRSNLPNMMLQRPSTRRARAVSKWTLMGWPGTRQLKRRHGNGTLTRRLWVIS